MENNQPDFVFKVKPLYTPLIYRNCAKCEKTEKFYCSEKFRINAHQKKLDVWLVYKCFVCDATWNCTVMRRVNPTTINEELYHKFLSNDRETSWECAFNFDLLKRNNAKIDPDIEYAVEGPDINLNESETPVLCILYNFQYKFDLRLNALLSISLNLSRKRIETLHDKNHLEFQPSRMNIKKKIKDDFLVIINTEAVKLLLAQTSETYQN